MSESYPTIALGPVTVTPGDAAQEGARFLSYRLEQQIMRICVAGMVPLLTMPGHEEPLR